MIKQFSHHLYLHHLQPYPHSKLKGLAYRSTNTKAKKRRNYHYEKRSGTNVWIWLLTGMFVGILGAAIIYMMLMGNSTAKKYKQLAETNQNHKASHMSATAPKNTDATGSTNVAVVSEHSPKPKKTDTNPQFEFYNLLPGTEDTTNSPTNNAAVAQAVKNKTPIEKTTPSTSSTLAPTSSTTANPRAPVISLNTPEAVIAPAPVQNPHTTHHTQHKSAVKQTPTTQASNSSNTVEPQARSVKPSSSKPSYPVSSPVVKNPPKLSDLPLKNLPKSQNKLAAAQYLVQVGLFRKLNQADELKANLALQGFSPFIQRINAQDGAWFRVSIGPFASETKAKQQRQRLDRKHIKGVVVLQGGGIEH